MLAAALLIPALSGAQAEVAVGAGDPQLARLARGVPESGKLRLRGVHLEDLGTVELELERFRVFAPDAVILAGERRLPVPDHAYFRGPIPGLPGSLAVLAFKSGARVSGWISYEGDYWRVSEDGQLGDLATERAALPAAIAERQFRCAVDQLGANSVAALLAPSVTPDSTRQRSPGYSYSARVAVDTDWEFLDKFGGNTTLATDYVGDLFAYSSSIYEPEVDTSLYVSYLQLWPGADAGADPWTQSDCSSALSEFRSYWLSNRSGVERTLAHLLSGKTTGCGIAWVGALCSNSYGYAVSGSLSAQFDPLDPRDYPGIWDILVVSHEIGHNFGSRHTHCYNGVLGNSNPIDECYSGEGGCYSGPTSLPGCSPGGRCGTIMSYCHGLSGGYGNIELTFGTGHPYGDEPWRVPTVMSNYVQAVAGGDPSCLAPVVLELIFEDGFESGGTSAWSETQ